MRVRDDQHAAPQVLGPERLRPARRRHDDHSRQPHLVARARPSTATFAPPVAAAAVAAAVAAASPAFSFSIALAHYVATTAAIPLTVTAASSIPPTRAASAGSAAVALTYAS